MKGLRVKKNEGNGYTVIYCHYSCDPFKDEEWVEREKKLYPNLNDWKRMYEIDFFGVKGLPIYPTFSRNRHVCSVTYNPLRPILRGWDFGVDTSVCKFYQFDQWGRFLTLAEFVKHRVESFKAFALEVIDLSQRKFEPLEHKGKIIPIVFEDYGDYWGTYSSDGKGQMYAEILGGLGIGVACTPFSKTTKDRAIEIVNRLLNEEVLVNPDKGIKTPKFLVDESCQHSISALSGGYVYDKKERPLSPNHPYEDVMDTDHYTLIHKLAMVDYREEKEEDNPLSFNSISGYLT